MSASLHGANFTIRKKFLKIFGGAFHVYDSEGNVVLYAKQKAFRLKEDIRLFTGEDMQTELLRIQARQVIDFSAAYDVVDMTTGEIAGTLKRKGLKSVLKDEWLVLDPAGNEIGCIKEDHLALALMRRFLTDWIPQRFTFFANGQVAAQYQQRFNPFIRKIDIDLTPGGIDRRLGIAGAVLLCAIEGRQS